MPENNEKFPSHFLKPKETSSNVFFLSDQLTKTPNIQFTITKDKE